VIRYGITTLTHHLTTFLMNATKPELALRFTRDSQDQPPLSRYLFNERV
jgi:hypothetical protein